MLLITLGTCEAASLACSYVEELSQEDFLVDKRTQQAVILNIVVIGEVATKLMRDFPEFVEMHPDVPWRSMKGMRNRLAHGYFEIDLKLVWETVKSALPDLIEKVGRLR